jgi:indole-3-glycerol phosphate synthase
LGRIVAEAAGRVADLRAHEADLARRAAAVAAPPAFGQALRGSAVCVIAEVKRRSPSKGLINGALSAPAQAVAYERGGAAAISVLTEPAHFGGSNDDLAAVRGAVRLPVLKKDFHIDPVQLVEARAIGASAALLIARALEPALLVEMVARGQALGLELLVEVRDERELDRALEAGARIIGINNRNLETLEIDPATAERLLGRVPASIVAIAESGVTGRDDVTRVAAAGADAVLVGSSVSGANDPSAAVRALAGVDRVPRVA